MYGNGDGPNGSATNYPDSLLDPNGNTVIIISGGTLNNSVYGGYADANGTGNATSANNSVVISGGTVNNDVYGSCADATVTGNATSANNSVIISGGTVNYYVYGGYAFANNGNATASHNTVIISGGTVNNDVYGGYAYAINGNAAATYNTITLSGSPVFDDPNVILYGGVATRDQFTGNTLNLWNYNGSPVEKVMNFEFYNFIVPATQAGPVLEATDVALGDGAGRASVFMVNTIGGTGPWALAPTYSLLTRHQSSPMA